MDELLAESSVFNYSQSTVKRFICSAIEAGSTTDVLKARDLFYAVRDGINYEVFGTELGESGLSAAAVVDAGKGFCLHKSILYVSTCRAMGIPARLAAATVENHLSTPELEALVGGSTFLHWYTEIKIENRWVKLTPVFGKLLCRVFNIQPLEFSESTDTVQQESNNGGSMKFLSVLDVPSTPSYRSLINLVQGYHPKMITNSGRVPSTSAELVAHHASQRSLNDN